MKTFKDLKVGDIVYSLSFDWVHYVTGGDLKECYLKEDNEGNMYLYHMENGEEVRDYLFNHKKLPDSAVLPCYSNDYYDKIYATDKVSIYSYIKEYMDREIEQTQNSLDILKERIKIIEWHLNSFKNESNSR